MILPQMNENIKYLENREKNMSFMTKDDNLLDKHNEMWDKIKKSVKHKISKHACL